MHRVLFVLALLPLIACGSSAPLLPTHSAPTSVVIDGDASDWQGALTAAEKSPVTLGVRSDAEYVYVAVVTSDRAIIRQTLLTGMVVWLDADGGKGKGFGVHFPLGAIREGRALDPAALRGERRGGDAENSARLREMTRELAIVQGDDRLVMERAAATGIASDVSLQNGTLTLELKVPLAQTGSSPFAVGARRGSTIGVGIETPELDREALRSQMQGQRGQGQGGRGGRGGGMRGGQGDRGGAGGAQRGQISNPVSVWVRAALTG